MVGGLLDLLDGLGIGFAEISYQTQQVSASPRRERFEFGEPRIAQIDKPGNFNLHAPLHVALLAHQRPQFHEFGRITAVQWRQG